MEILRILAYAAVGVFFGILKLLDISDHAARFEKLENSQKETK